MESQSLKILIIDDDDGDIEIFRRYVEEIEEFHTEFHDYNRWQDGLEFIAKHEIDMIFVDYRLGGETGLDVFKMVRDKGCEKPVVLITGQGSETIAVEAMKAGIADYVVKEHLNKDNLIKVIANALSKFEMEQELKSQQRLLEELARTDGLTGLWNKRYLMERLGEYINESRRYGSILSLLMIDLDHFKDINDQHGHLMGDIVLAEVARIIQSTIRKTDHPARYGGEEICVLLTNTPLEGAYMVAERIRKLLSENVFKTSKGIEFAITCSIGIAQLIIRDDSPESLLDRADKALYVAKESGRNTTITELQINAPALSK